MPNWARQMQSAFSSIAWNTGANLPGELLIMRAGRVQSFNVLQQRLNRKIVTPKLLADFPAHLRVYDLLVEAEEDLREQPFAARRARLGAGCVPIGSLDLGRVTHRVAFAPVRTRMSPSGPPVGDSSSLIPELPEFTAYVTSVNARPAFKKVNAEDAELAKSHQPQDT